MPEHNWGSGHRRCAGALGMQKTNKNQQRRKEAPVSYFPCGAAVRAGSLAAALKVLKAPALTLTLGGPNLRFLSEALGLGLLERFWGS